MHFVVILINLQNSFMDDKIKSPLIIGLAQGSTLEDSYRGIKDTYSKNKTARITVRLEYELKTPLLRNLEAPHE